MGTNGAHLTRGQGWVLALTGAALGSGWAAVGCWPSPAAARPHHSSPVQTDTPKIEIRS